MALSIGGAIRAVILADTNAIGPKVYLDIAPEDTMPPYITYNDDVSVSGKVFGDRRITHYTTTVQLNIWQSMRHEDSLLPPRIRELFNGISLNVDGTTMKPAVQILSANRLAEPIGSNLVHHEITLQVTHEAMGV